MAVIHIFILLGTGAVVGFASGLLGIGGAFLMTPVQYFIFTDMGIDADLAIKLAFGTNLMVILPTAISGTWRHHKKNAVWWRAALIMGGCSFLASYGGATLATHLPGDALKISFGVVALIGGGRMLFHNPSRSAGEPRENIWLWIAWAIPIGTLTGLLGIGGGVIAIPILVLGLRFEMHTAVATSLAMMILNSIGGVTGYIVNGIGVSGLPDYSLGYVNLLSCVLLAVPSIVMAQIGAITAHRLPARKLTYLFVIIILYVGLKMIGLFDLLGWSI